MHADDVAPGAVLPVLRTPPLTPLHLTAWATVETVTPGDGYAELELRVGLRGENGEETSPGRARGILPVRGGRVPDPWSPEP